MRVGCFVVAPVAHADADFGSAIRLSSANDPHLHGVAFEGGVCGGLVARPPGKMCDYFPEPPRAGSAPAGRAHCRWNHGRRTQRSAFRRQGAAGRGGAAERVDSHPPPLVYQELPYDPEFLLYNHRLTAMRLSTATPDEAYWRVRRQVILRHTGEVPLEVRGPDAELMLDRVFTRDVSLQASPVSVAVLAKAHRSAEQLTATGDARVRWLQVDGTSGSGRWQPEPNRGRIPGAVSDRRRPWASGFRGLRAGATVVEPVALAVHLENVYMVGQAEAEPLMFRTESEPLPRWRACRSWL